MENIIRSVHALCEYLEHERLDYEANPDPSHIWNHVTALRASLPKPLWVQRDKMEDEAIKRALRPLVFVVPPGVGVGEFDEESMDAQFAALGKLTPFEIDRHLSVAVVQEYAAAVNTASALIANANALIRLLDQVRAEGCPDDKPIESTEAAKKLVPEFRA
jgi:hypothetical protein